MDKYKIADHIIPIVGFGCRRDNEIPVIYYHSVVETNSNSYADINIEQFKQHMRYLFEMGYETLRFEDVKKGFAKTKKEKKVLIAFDDGYKNNYELIFSFMKKHNLKYNIFLIGGAINTSGFLSENEIQIMNESGIVGFGAHTFSHMDSRKLTNNLLNKEVELTNKVIEDIIHKKVEDYCFPFGYYNDETIQFLTQNTQYKRYYTSDYRKTYVVNNKTIKGRIAIRGEDNIRQFDHKVKGLYNILYYKKFITR